MTHPEEGLAELECKERGKEWWEMRLEMYAGTGDSVCVCVCVYNTHEKI